MRSGSDCVPLKDGPTVPYAAIALATALERRGFLVTTDGADLLVAPGDRLTDDDVQQIRRWKAHLLEVVRYCDRLVM